MNATGPSNEWYGYGVNNSRVWKKRQTALMDALRH